MINKKFPVYAIMMQDYKQELAQIRDVLKKNLSGMSVTDIARALHKNKNTVGRYLDIMLISGQVNMKTFGMAKVFTLSQRVPLSAMLSFSNELIMVLDSDHRITEINDNFLALLDMERPEVVGKQIDYISPPDVDIHEMLETLMLESEKPVSVVTFRSSGGKEKIYRQKSLPTVFDDGSSGLTLILEDITYRVRAERELAEREERFRMMVENIHDGLAIIENGRIVFSNRRISEITGYTAEELDNRRPENIVDPKESEKIRNLLVSPGEEIPGPIQLRVWIVRKDGIRRYVYGRITRYVRKETVYHFIIFTDMTEIKEQEDALWESEQKFRRMAHAIHEGFVIIEDGKIVESNRRVHEITGYSDQEISTMNTDDLVSADDERKIKLAVDASVRNPGIPDSITFRIRTKGGKYRWIRGNIISEIQNGHTSTYLTMSDVTGEVERDNATTRTIESLHNLIRSIPVPMCHTDEEGIIRGSSEQFRELTGTSESDRDLAIGSIIPELDGFHDISEIISQLKGGKPITSAGTLKIHDGSLIPVQLVLRYFSDDLGGHITWVVIPGGNKDHFIN
jgi:PAS domain S-box-containing protein